MTEEGALATLKFWKYLPRRSYAILASELCERFNYYGLLAILPTFLTAYLGFRQPESVQIMSAVNLASLAFAILGTILADAFLGRFVTITLFYLMVSVGSIVSMLTTPLIKSRGCFGRSDGYPFAFGLPAVLMVLAVVAFTAGYFWYKPGPPKSRLMLDCLLVLVLVLVPVGYLVLPRLGPVARTPVAQIKLGIILAALSFVLASGLQLYIDSRSHLQADPANPNVLWCTGNCVHILWQVPQYVAITMAEVLVSVAGLTMVYSLSPAKLKSTCAAVSSLSGAAGNLVVLLFSKVDPVSWVAGRRLSEAAGNFVLWTVLDLLGFLWFWWATRGLDFGYEKFEEIKDAPETADSVPAGLKSAGSKTQMPEYGVSEYGVSDYDVSGDSVPEDATPATACLPS